ncbi:hypothetical protein V5O48_008256 [Marasmius crinis-equi]|uniref:Uncharacterized protein n=1 Tax=Marasmius crinis-equi TaxID=585013 RepID=A0ABR3FER3_9AGAR
MLEYTFKDYTVSDVDELFLERFEAFMDKSLSELKAFSEREERPFEEMRFRFAEWHSKHLFDNCSTASVYQTALDGERASKTRDILVEVSRVLELLYHIWGMQSFILAVDPQYPANESFLGGSTAGRDFWRGLRSGGENGAVSFKQQCIKQMDDSSRRERLSPVVEAPGSCAPLQSSSTVTSKSSQLSAREVKSELYDRTRRSLRAVSGIRNAEMKWTNPDRLYTYGVSLVGWPSDIPAQNPSALNLSQNKRLLDLLQNGTLRFLKTILDPSVPPPSSVESVEAQETDALFDWAIRDDNQFDDSSVIEDSEVVRPLKRPRSSPDEAKST